jgi:hypothetical protein
MKSNNEYFGAPPKHQVLEHQLQNNQLLKHQLSKTGVANLLNKWAKFQAGKSWRAKN